MGGCYAVTTAESGDFFDPRTAKIGDELWTVFWHREDFDYEEPSIMHGVVASVEIVESTRSQYSGSVSISEVWRITFVDDTIDDRSWHLNDGKPDTRNYHPYFWTDKEALMADLKRNMQEAADELREEVEERLRAIAHAEHLATTGDFRFKNENE